MRPYMITTFVAEGLMALAAFLGLLVPGFYRDSPFVVAQLRAQDFVTLFVVVPGLAIAMPKARIGNLRARVIWLGLMSYSVYTYAVYSFEVKHNPAFLLYVALLCLSTLSVAGGAVNAKPRGFSLVLGERFPRRTTGWFLALTGGIIAAMMMTDVIVALAGNRVPPSVIHFDTPTNGTYVLNLAFLIPAYISGGVLLLLAHPVGYLMAGILLTTASAYGLGVMCMNFSTILGGYTTDPLFSAVFTAHTALSFIFLAFYLRALHTPAWHRFDLPIAREELP